MSAYDSPTKFTNLWAWYKADNKIAATGSNVTAWDDSSGYNRNLTIVGTPTRILNALNGMPVVSLASGAKLRTPALTANFAGGSTLIAVWKIDSGITDIWDQTAGYLIGAPSLTPNGLMGLNATPWQVNGGNGYHCFTYSIAATQLTSYPAGNSPHVASIDHSEVTTYVVVHQPVVGNYLEFPRQGAMTIAELLLFDRRLMYLELLELNRYLAEKWGLWFAATDPASTSIVWMGNSTTRGGPPVPFVRQNPTAKVMTVSLAADGMNSNGSFAQRDQANQIASWAGRQGVPSIMVWHHGHNDVGNDAGAVVAQDIFKDPNGVIQGFRRAGGRVLIHTCTPLNTIAIHEVTRTADNNWFRANWSDYADGIYDLGATAEFGVWDNTASWNATTNPAPAGTSRGDFPQYWQDNVHHTAAGAAAKATLTGPALRAMMGRVSLVSNVSGAVSLTHSYAAAGWTYQWYRATTAFNPLDPTTRGAALAGATSQTLIDTAAEPASMYGYSCRLTHPTQGTVWSAPMYLMTKPGPARGGAGGGQGPFTNWVGG